MENKIAGQLLFSSSSNTFLKKKLRMKNIMSIFPFFGIFCLWITVVNGIPMESNEIDCESRTNSTRAYSQHSVLFHDREVCCDKEKYRLGTTPGFLKYFKDCNVEPENKTMSLIDSRWTTFECVLKKGLGTDELSQKNFVELMAQNLTSSKRSAIFELIKEMKTTPVKSNGNIQLQFIKTYWAQYFEAEYKVCTKSSTYSDDSVKTRIHKLWEPSHQCYDGKAPFYHELVFSVTDLHNCSKSVDAKYSLMLNDTQEYKALSACAYILNGFLTQEDLSNSSLNYVDLVGKSIPKFFSSSVKKQVEDIFLKKFKAEYSKQTKGGPAIEIQELFDTLTKSTRKQFGNETDTAKINVYVNMEIMSKILENVFDAIGRICRGRTMQEAGNLGP